MESFDLLLDNSVVDSEVDLKMDQTLDLEPTVVEPMEEDHERKVSYILTVDGQEVTTNLCWCQATSILTRMPIGKCPIAEEREVMFKEEKYKMLSIPTIEAPINRQASSIANETIVGPVVLWKLE